MFVALQIASPLYIKPCDFCFVPDRKPHASTKRFPLSRLSNRHARLLASRQTTRGDSWAGGTARRCIDLNWGGNDRCGSKIGLCGDVRCMIPFPPRTDI